MGDRGAANELPTETDIARMSLIVEEGLRAGALGFSTSRTVLHKSVDGELVPGTTATPEELLGIGRAMGRVGYGVFELASDLLPEWNEFDWMGALSRETGLPVSFTALQSPLKALAFEEQLAEMRAENAKGANLVAQVSLRGTGLILGWQATFHPFAFKPSWLAIKDLPWPQQLVQLSDPAFRERLLAEEHVLPDTDLRLLLELMIAAFQMQYPMVDGFDYEPGPEDSIAARAASKGISPEVCAYDAMMTNEGRGFIYFPLLNYADGNLNFLEPVLESDDCINSLSDGGAHCGTICDAAATTFLLQHWVRDRDGGRISIERAVRRQCADTAKLYGLDDRGIVAGGYLADLNIIDLEALQLNQPWVAHDLPAGGKRLLQDARGYRATIKSGVVTFSEGVFQGRTPGTLIRGPQQAPATTSPRVAATD
jgi:N-acyl-D-aspartate/D-glutamate deacylase